MFSLYTQQFPPWTRLHWFCYTLCSSTITTFSIKTNTVTLFISILHISDKKNVNSFKLFVYYIHRCIHIKIKLIIWKQTKKRNVWKITIKRITWLRVRWEYWTQVYFIANIYMVIHMDYCHFLSPKIWARMPKLFTQISLFYVKLQKGPVQEFCPIASFMRSETRIFVKKMLVLYSRYNFFPMFYSTIILKSSNIIFWALSVIFPYQNFAWKSLAIHISIAMSKIKVFHIYEQEYRNTIGNMINGSTILWVWFSLYVWSKYLSLTVSISWIRDALAAFFFFGLNHF